MRRVLATLIVLALASAPLLYGWRNGPITGVNIPAKDFNDLDFLAVSIAFAAYVAVVRFALIQRLGSGAQSPTLSKVLVLSLIPADFNLVLCRSIMAARVSCIDAIGQQRLDAWLPYVAFCFLCAGAYLALQHRLAWVLSLLKFFDFL